MAPPAAVVKTACPPCAGTGGIWVPTPDGDADQDVCDYCDRTGVVQDPQTYFCSKCLQHHQENELNFTVHAPYRETTGQLSRIA